MITIDFNDGAVELLKILQDKYNCKTKEEALEKALKIAAILAAEQDDSGAVIIEGVRGRTKLVLI